jgi:hypothetical protein
METLIGGQETLRTVDAVTRRVLTDAKRSFEGLVDDVVLEAAAREAVSELWQDSIKVTTFVPVLALRRMREIVLQHDAVPTGVER